MAASDIRWSSPVDPERDEFNQEKDAACLHELFHVHVWPDLKGIHVRTHGQTLNFGKWPHELKTGGRVKNGPLFDWRVRRAIINLDAYVRKIKDEHASIFETYERLRVDSTVDI